MAKPFRSIKLLTWKEMYMIRNVSDRSVRFSHPNKDVSYPGHIGAIHSVKWRTGLGTLASIQLVKDYRAKHNL